MNYEVNTPERIILGIDPGTTIMGYGVIRVVGKKADWNVSFEIGELEVVVTFGDKKISDRVMTAGDVSGLHLEDVTPYDSDLHIINVSAVDSKGVVVPHFDKTVCFCSDDGEIIGVGNGEKPCKIRF